MKHVFCGEHKTPMCDFKRIMDGREYVQGRLKGKCNVQRRGRGSLRRGAPHESEDIFPHMSADIFPTSS
jgi:hypothetical protein